MSATRQAAVESNDVVEVSGRRVGEPPRLGEILEVLGRPDRPTTSALGGRSQERLLPGETTTIKAQAESAALRHSHTSPLQRSCSSRSFVMRASSSRSCRIDPRPRGRRGSELGVLPQAVQRPSSRATQRACTCEPSFLLLAM